MRGRIFALVLAAACAAPAGAGEIYRCTAPNGDVMFTNIACPAQAKVQQVASYVAEPDLPEPVRDIAVEAAAVSAREAREAAAQAQAAAFQSAQAAYLQAEAAAQYAELESQRNANADNGYPIWVGAYPLPARSPGHGAHGDHRHHHGPNRSGTAQLPYPPTLPINTSLFVRQR